MIIQKAVISAVEFSSDEDEEKRAAKAARKAEKAAAGGVVKKRKKRKKDLKPRGGFIPESTRKGIKERRQALSYTINMLASKMGVKSKVVRQWESGEATPDPIVFNQFQMVLQCRIPKPDYPDYFDNDASWEVDTEEERRANASSALTFALSDNNTTGTQTGSGSGSGFGSVFSQVLNIFRSGDDDNQATADDAAFGADAADNLRIGHTPVHVKPESESKQEEKEGESSDLEQKKTKLSEELRKLLRMGPDDPDNK